MEYLDPPTTDNSFMSVIEHAERRKKVRREFAESIPSDLLGRLYGAFVNARVFNDKNEAVDASVFYIVLGAGVGEEWSVQFSDHLIQRLLIKHENSATAGSRPINVFIAKGGSE